MTVGGTRQTTCTDEWADINRQIEKPTDTTPTCMVGKTNTGFPKNQTQDMPTERWTNRQTGTREDIYTDRHDKPIQTNR